MGTSEANKRAKAELIKAIEEAYAKNPHLGPIPKAGKGICFKKALPLYGLEERFKTNPWVLEMKVEASTTAKRFAKQDKELNEQLVAGGKPPLEKSSGGVRLGLSAAAESVGFTTSRIAQVAKCRDDAIETRDAIQALLAGKNMAPLVADESGHFHGLLAAGIALNVVDEFKYLQLLAKQSDGYKEASAAVVAELIRQQKPPLKMNSANQLIGLVDAARDIGIDFTLYPALRAMARKNDGADEAYQEVKKLLEEQNKPALLTNRAGSVIGLQKAARELGILGKHEYFRKLAARTVGYEDAFEFISDMREKNGMPPLKFGVDGRVIGLLAAAIELQCVHKFSALRLCARQAEGCEETFQMLKKLLEDNHLPPFETTRSGATIGLLATGVYFDVVSKDAYLRKRLKDSNQDADAKAAAVKEGATRFAELGTDPFIPPAEMTIFARNILKTHVPCLFDRSQQPQDVFIIFEACEGRANSILGAEALKQIKYKHCVWEFGGKEPHEAIKQLNLVCLHETTNPYSAFQVEAELHKQAISLGSLYPSERMFKYAGAGGFNQKHHWPGKKYGVYLLVHRGGAPAGWKLKENFDVKVGEKRGRDDEDVDEEDENEN